MVLSNLIRPHLVIKKVCLVLGMERFNRSLKNDLKNVLKNREGRFSVFWRQFSIQKPTTVKPSQQCLVSIIIWTNIIKNIIIFNE
jgi:hypothetical protein